MVAIAGDRHAGAGLLRAAIERVVGGGDAGEGIGGAQHDRHAGQRVKIVRVADQHAGNIGQGAHREKPWW